PFTVTVVPSMVTSTPAGTVIGSLPIRDMSNLPFLPNIGDDFAADALLAGIAVGHDAVARRDDRRAKATEHARHLFLASVNAQTRLGDALDAANGLGLLVAVLEHDLEGGARLALDDIVTLDVALFLHDAGYLDKLL